MGHEKRDRGVVWYGVGEAVIRGEGLTAATPQSLPLSLFTPAISEISHGNPITVTAAIQCKYHRGKKSVEQASARSAPHSSAMQTGEALPPLLQMTSRPLRIARPGPVWNLSISN
ncbi:hypothetical protein J6590_011017 [Homalodisca vitripennis]|nr:hypothetical protein J6590_011017 [Homalodisca vitripennis]